MSDRFYDFLFFISVQLDKYLAELNKIEMLEYQEEQ